MRMNEHDIETSIIVFPGLYPDFENGKLQKHQLKKDNFQTQRAIKSHKLEIR